MACIGMDLSGRLPEREEPEALLAELAESREDRLRLIEEARELRLELERARTEPRGNRADGPEPELLREIGEETPPLEEFERRYIERVLERTRGRVSGRRGAAGILGLHPNTLRSRMKKLGIASGVWVRTGSGEARRDGVLEG